MNLLTRYPVLLEKSQKPNIKAQKGLAIESLRQQLETTLGKKYSTGQLLKKIANMKKIVEKTDRKKTGNRRMILKPWERKMFEMLQGDINPVFCRVEGAISCGFGAAASLQKQSEKATYHGIEEMNPLPTRTATQKIKRRCLSEESEETQELSMSELQRLVLLEQLKYYRMKTRLMMKKQAFSAAPNKCNNSAFSQNCFRSAFS